MVPDWLHWLSVLSLLAGAIAALMIAADLVRHPQHMWIMNFVWPVVALFGSLLALAAYYRIGRQRGHVHSERPFAASVGVGTSHCGAGCTLGDLCAEWLIVAFPAIATWFGWQTVFADKIFAVWIVDFLFAFGFGIAFQYFSIAPMRGLGLADGLRAALKADALSLIAWQVGMYGFMAVAHFVIFARWLGAPLETPTAESWFMMQIAMLCGFVTAYPVNWWLIRQGIKEAM